MRVFVFIYIEHVDLESTCLGEMYAISPFGSLSTCWEAFVRKLYGINPFSLKLALGGIIGEFWGRIQLNEQYKYIHRPSQLV
jgi:hypothetical protein